MAVLWAQVADLPEVVTQPERCAFFEVEALLPSLRLIHDLELDMFSEIVHAHLFGEAGEHCFARSLDQLWTMTKAMFSSLELRADLLGPDGLWRLGGNPPKRSVDLKGLLLEGFTALRSVTGTEGALKAMQSNEKTTNKKYQEALAISREWSLPELEIGALFGLGDVAEQSGNADEAGLRAGRDRLRS